VGVIPSNLEFLPGSNLVFAITLTLELSKYVSGLLLQKYLFQPIATALATEN